jgi:hypothetical protein
MFIHWNFYLRALPLRFADFINAALIMYKYTHTHESGRTCYEP